MGTKERNIITPEELAIAYAELYLAGHIEYFDNDERFRFTDAGLDAAFEQWYKLPPTERLSIFLLTKLIIEAGSELDKIPGETEG
jgi:hypothetical protein